MTIQRLENVGIVVDDLAAATTFFVQLGPKVLGEGGWVDRVVGLEGVRVDIAMLETSDGHGRLELMTSHAPPAPGGGRNAPPNTLGIRRIAFAVDDIDAAVAGLQARGAELLGGVERYETVTGAATSTARRGSRHACGADWLRGPGATTPAVDRDLAGRGPDETRACAVVSRRCLLSRCTRSARPRHRRTRF